MLLEELSQSLIHLLIITHLYALCIPAVLIIVQVKAQVKGRSFTVTNGTMVHYCEIPGDTMSHLNLRYDIKLII